MQYKKNIHTKSSIISLKFIQNISKPNKPWNVYLNLYIEIFYKEEKKGGKKKEKSN
jgi:hypothetical protein